MDDLALAGTATSLPSGAGSVEDAGVFFAIAFGSNLPVYGPGAASVLGGAGDCGDAVVGDAPDLLSIWSRMLLAPPEAASSFCFLSRSAACFCFQASNLARRSAFFSSSVWAAGAGVGVFETWRNISVNKRLQ